MKEIQAAPPASITAPSSGKTRDDPAAIIVRPKIPMPADTITSAEPHEDRARCMTSAPTTAPNPNEPSRMPYPMGLPLIRCAMEGSKASKALAKNIADSPARKQHHPHGWREANVPDCSHGRPGYCLGRRGSLDDSSRPAIHNKHDPNERRSVQYERERRCPQMQSPCRPGQGPTARAKFPIPMPVECRGFW